jgi:ribosome-associated protein
VTVISAEINTLALASKTLDDGKAKNIVALDVHAMTVVTDHMVVCTGTSRRHVKSLAENLAQTFKDLGRRPGGIEGLEDGEWVLVDLGDVLVHVMQEETRAFFELEKLWSVGPSEND